MTSPAETILACARFLGLLDLIVLSDAALHAGDVTITDLVAVSVNGVVALPVSGRRSP